MRVTAQICYTANNGLRARVQHLLLQWQLASASYRGAMFEFFIVCLRINSSQNGYGQNLRQTRRFTVSYWKTDHYNRLWKGGAIRTCLRHGLSINTSIDACMHACIHSCLEFSKQSSNFQCSFRNSLRNFEAHFETGCENSIMSAKWRSKFRPTFRGLARFSQAKTIASSKNQRKFVEDSFSSKSRSFSKLFVEFRSHYFCTILYKKLSFRIRNCGFY